MLSAEVERLDGVVGHDVVVVEGDVIEADTAGELQAVVHVPLVLQVDAILVELNL